MFTLSYNLHIYPFCLILDYFNVHFHFVYSLFMPCCFAYDLSNYVMVLLTVPQTKEKSNQSPFPGRCLQNKTGSFKNINKTTNRTNHEKTSHWAATRHLGPVVQSIVSLTSSLVVKMLTVLVSLIFTGIFVEKMWVASLITFFSKNISV